MTFLYVSRACALGQPPVRGPQGEVAGGAAFLAALHVAGDFRDIFLHTAYEPAS